MPQLRTHRAFICHAWTYGDEYYKLVEFLDTAPNFSWQNVSVPGHDPIHSRSRSEIEYELRNRVREVDVFLVLAGMYAAHSDWMEFELEFPRRIGRPIIGVKPRGSERIPVAVQNAAHEIVGFRADSIVTAVRRHAVRHSRPWVSG